jgi:hypothetical protein
MPHAPRFWSLLSEARPAPGGQSKFCGGGSERHLLIETFERIDGVQFGAVLGREGQVREDVVLAVVHQPGERMYPNSTARQRDTVSDRSPPAGERCVVVPSLSQSIECGTRLPTR